MTARIIRLLVVAILLVPTHTAWAARIPDDIKNTVTFVFTLNAKGERIPAGTAFFVSVPSKEPDRSFVYLATAKHVLLKAKGSFHDDVWIRLNKKDGAAEFIKIGLQPDDKQIVWEHPTDTSCDIAVIPVQADPMVYDFKTIPYSMLSDQQTLQELQIGTGSDTFFTGLFSPYYGQRRNQPIVRYGRVSLISDEPVAWGDELLELYLIETFSFGGNSGSPVFFYLGSDRNPGSLVVGPPVIKLAGVMKGHFLENRPLGVMKKNDDALVPVSRANVGIAAVVPAGKLHEILFGDGLTSLRSTSHAEKGE